MGGGYKSDPTQGNQMPADNVNQQWADGQADRQWMHDRIKRDHFYN